jgi:hypothetical protein
MSFCHRGVFMGAFDSTEELSAALVAVLIIGIGGPTLGLIGLLEGRRRIGSRWPRPGTVLSVLIALTAGSLALAGQPSIIWLSTAMLAVVDLLSRGLSRFVLQAGILGRRLATARRLHAALLLVGAPIIAFGLGRYINSLTQSPDLNLFEDEASRPLGDMRPTYRYAVTDRGRFINVYTTVLAIEDPDGAKLNKYEERIQRSGVFRILPVSKPELATNCHGWVFLGAGYCLLGQDIDAILEDNAYEKVAQPRHGDLIVYRNGPANIVHTGLVRFADEGMVLVESKWGVLGRYLHPPENQPYSQEWFFCRSPRLSHLLYGDWGQPSPNIAFTNSGAEVQP